MNHPSPTLPYASLSDEELLAQVYMNKNEVTPLAIELAQRLEWALDEARKPCTSINEVLEERDRD